MKPSTRERIFRYIVNYKATSGGASPSVREIVRALDLSSTSIVNYHVKALEADGRLVRDGHHLSIPGERWSLSTAETLEAA
jgi:SOS-response transcriptional repressor LexA